MAEVALSSEELEYVVVFWDPYADKEVARDLLHIEGAWQAIVEYTNDLPHGPGLVVSKAFTRPREFFTKEYFPELYV